MPALSPCVRRRFRGCLSLLVGLLLNPDARAEIVAPELSIVNPPGADDPVRISSSFQTGALLRLESSPNLLNWQEAGRLHDALYSYPDPSPPSGTRRYYRVQASARTPADDWKNQILFPEEAFQSPFTGGVRWVKFVILTNEPERVYFQDSARFPFHYDFATQRLAPFNGMSRAAFDAVTLHRQNQQAVLGTVLYPPRTNFVEYGVQFVGLDPYTPDEVARWLKAVQRTVYAEAGAGICYMPVYEQSETVRQQETEYASRGITVASTDRWETSNHVYSAGWALGRLKFFPANEIDAAFTDGRLVPQDILLTDGVPAETPLVAGLISLAPSTPNSHTAILAQSFGIPFVHIPDPAERTRVQQLAGRKVILRAITQFNEGLVRVIDVETIDPAVEAELLKLKEPVPIKYAEKASYGSITANTQALTPSDIKYFGGKAANYGLLRRTVPDNCPAAIAFSFDLWDAFMDQTLQGGLTLRAEIASRLAPHRTYPPQIAAMKTALSEIRLLIRNTAIFSAAQKQSILTALGGFIPSRKIRFRSSTNVEDSETFTGAGLYDSYSGCILDDLDGDNSGPCGCEATEPEERGVFRAIQRVYASFYNDNAYLERLRHGVDEAKVGMGVLVHHSFPDEEELANGVAALDFRFLNPPNMEGNMVTQLGAESVTNPDGTALPEVVDTYAFGSGLYRTLMQRSSRVPLGGYVMTWEADYAGFQALFRTVGVGFKQLYPSKVTARLDFEYKKDVNLGLVVKQVREIPVTTSTTPVTSFVIDDPTEWRVAQKEAGDVFSNHRLKSIWNLHTASKRLTAANLAQGIYTQGTLEYLEGAARQTLNGSLAAWPSASHSADGTTNGWTTGSGAGLRTWQLKNTLTTSVTGSKPPIFTATDFPATITVTYATPQPIVNFSGQITTTSSHFAVLERAREVTPGCPFVERTVDNGKGVQVTTSFFWPNEPPAAAGYTAPLVRFERTVITGLISQPITLTGYYSQTYRPGHHNFTEEFIFEPRLEPGIPAAILTELAAANISFLYMEGGLAGSAMVVAGLDGALRKL
ncbi:MAG TPA: PEP/pyruvate-binding domain-containing protein [Verrucomicrobiales bacterium]|nr:PEP/pyruvate-binding domain-containing protein [Verrucomicrobiales bacterium]